jgi:Spy/CpxP family protein refolding chaperone
MFRSPQRTLICLTACGVLLIAASTASAQRRGFGRMFGATPAVTLAQLEEVQTELKLTDEQKGKVTKLNADLGEERRAAREDSAGDFEKMRKEVALLNAEFDKEWHAALDEAQQKRSQEIYLQVNGPVALTDEPIAKALAITDEQKGKLETALDESRAKSREAFQNFQSLSDEERAKKSEEVSKARDESLLAVLTDEQKKQFEEMHGAKLEVDLSKLPRPGGR